MVEGFESQASMIGGLALGFLHVLHSFHTAFIVYGGCL